MMKDIFNKKIGFDCDDCVIDTITALNRVSKKRYGIDVTSSKSFDLKQHGLSQYEVDDIIKTALMDWQNVDPVNGAIDFMRRYHEETRNVLEFITYRGNWIPEYFTFSWFDKWIPDIPYKVYFPKHEQTKSSFVKELGIEVYVEDRFKYAIEVADHCDLVVMMNKPWNFGRMFNKTNIYRVDSWQEVYDIKM